MYQWSHFVSGWELYCHGLGSRGSRKDFFYLYTSVSHCYYVISRKRSIAVMLVTCMSLTVGSAMGVSWNVVRSCLTARRATSLLTGNLLRYISDIMLHRRRYNAMTHSSSHFQTLFCDQRMFFSCCVWLSRRSRDSIFCLDHCKNSD